MQKMLILCLTLLTCYGQGIIGNSFISFPPSQSGNSTLILDTISTPAYASYSWARKTRAAYNGDIILIRRSSDNTTQPIGVSGDGEEINKTAITTFCAGTDGFIVTTYDQTGHSRDVTQSDPTKQPQIVSSGTLILGSNNRVSASFDGVNDYASYTVTVVQPLTYYSVLSVSGVSDGKVILSMGFTTGAAMRQRIDNTITLNAGTWLFSASAYTPSTWYRYRTSFISGNGEIVRNGVSLTTGTVGSNGGSAITIAYPTAGSGSTFKISEWLIFTSEVSSSDETIINNNMATFYAIP